MTSKQIGSLGRTAGAWLVVAASLGTACGDESTTDPEQPPECEGETCETETPSTCGDGKVDAGEACDDGNADFTDACLPTCVAATCGDAVLQAGAEDCDDGNTSDDDACLATCEPATCGDGFLRAGVEGCDDGNAEDSDACLSTCEPATCGDGFLRAGVEECDDANTSDDDACLSTCVPATCGDGFLQRGVEGCDDGNGNNDDACLATCVSATCGDGVIQAGVEGCDDANADDTDACLSICTPAFCGDGFLHVGVETCDDGDLDDDDSCPTTCVPASCGDGFVQAGAEECDDGNTNDTDACSASCNVAVCGDGIVQTGVETCDDANTDDTDACLTTCQIASCGDGFLQAGVETCDDGNADDTDACPGSCAPASCGDGYLLSGVEACDDGGTAVADGCDAACKPEVLPYFEDFDDGQHDLTLTTNSATVLWHVTATQAVSPPNSLRFADPATNNYAPGHVIGDADTPYFLVPSDGAALSVRVRKHTEVNVSFDRFWIRALDVNHTVIAEKEIIGTFTSFRQVGLMIPASAAGTYLRARFAFDSIDGLVNTNTGVFIDDVSIQVPSCGDGVTTVPEECDDANAVAGDGCNADCTPTCFGGSGADAFIADPAIGCYAAFSTALSWPEAEAACVGLGGHLVSITSATENSLVRALLPGTVLAIGSSDAAVEGTWTWSDGDTFSYTGWGAGEPNNSGGVEDCGLLQATGAWNDGVCSAAHGYVCEAP